MLKISDSVKWRQVEKQAAEALRSLLERSPGIEIGEIVREPSIGRGHPVDILASISAFGRHHRIACEVRSNGQPRHVRNAILYVRDYVANLDFDAAPMVSAPFLSERSRALCVEYGVGYLDLHGNAFLQLPGILIDVSVTGEPPAERRGLKSPFRPKAARILRVMLREPEHAWRVADLALAAGTSLGHVSNVRRALLNREWAEELGGGVVLSNPDAVLDAWRAAYRPPDGDAEKLYTSLHGMAFEDAAKAIFSLRPQHGGSLAFASFSAARWIAPYGRTGTEYFHADREGAAQIADALGASGVDRGENVNIRILEDQGILADTIEPAPGVICTSPVQTYLDLSVSGERGVESADHLRREVLSWGP